MNAEFFNSIYHMVLAVGTWGIMFFLITPLGHHVSSLEFSPAPRPKQPELNPNTPKPLNPKNPKRMHYLVPLPPHRPPPGLEPRPLGLEPHHTKPLNPTKS